MTRLSRNDWLDHGLVKLADDGFTALKADVLAKSLGISRGSFYHHFDDLSAFHEGVLQRWLEVSVMAFVVDLESSERTPSEKLAYLIEQAAVGDHRIEQAIRAWAFSDPKVAEMVKLVDHERMNYLMSQLVESGLEPDEAAARGVMIYLVSVGYYAVGGILDDHVRQAVLDQLIDFASTEA